MALALSRNVHGSPDLAVAIVNYRLTTEATPAVRHPDHIVDVHHALMYLVEHEAGYDPSDITLVGHSVGAWIALACVTSHAEGSAHGIADVPNLDRAIQQRIRTAVLVVRERCAQT